MGFEFMEKVGWKDIINNHYKKFPGLRRFWKGLAAVLNRRSTI
jgi:hypothetical protein